MKNSLVVSLFVFITLATGEALAGPLLGAGAVLELPGKSGHFDFMEVDARNDRLLAAHKGAGTLALVDLRNDKLLPAVEVGHVQGVAIDFLVGKYALGDDNEKKVVLLSTKSLTQIGEIPLAGPIDAVAVDSKRGRIYADEDDGSHIWVIDIRSLRQIAVIAIPGAPEVAAYDPKTDRIYQNIKTKDLLAVIDPRTNQIVAEWPTLPATGPHGLVIDQRRGQAFVAGHNGKLVEIDLKTGKRVSQADIAPGTDQIAFDARSRTIYCASKGFISVIKVTGSGLKHLGDVSDHPGAHTIAVDSKRRKVWISYASGTGSYLESFKIGR